MGKVLEEKKRIFMDAKRALKLAKPAFQRAQHQLALLTGEAKQGETYEEFAKRKESQLRGDATKAVNLLNAAKRVASAANDKAAAAKEKLAQARKDGTATAEMVAN